MTYVTSRQAFGRCSFSSPGKRAKCQKDVFPNAGLAVQRHGDELRLVTAPEVSSPVERHPNHPRPVPPSTAALKVLAIVAYRQPITCSGIGLIRASASDSVIATLLERGLIEHNTHHLFVTTRAFLETLGLRDLADLPVLG